jgi:ankyrin repeat protein
LSASAKSSKTDLKIIQLLVQGGANLLQPKKSDGMTALHIAAASNDVHLVDFIMKNVEN